MGSMSQGSRSNALEEWSGGGDNDFLVRVIRRLPDGTVTAEKRRHFRRGQLVKVEHWEHGEVVRVEVIQ
jgi:hypothetical protein